MTAGRLAELLKPRLTVYNRAEPLSAKQHAGLLLPHKEVLFGGAAGGGKSSWELHAALQYVDVPGYAAILLRKSYKQLAAPGGLMDRSKLWLGPTDAVWNESAHEWRFPSGAVLKFGYLDAVTDWMNYQGPEYQFAGFDELTQFREKDYRYLFSRLRRPKPSRGMGPDQLRRVRALSRVPLRMRGASNPGGPGHEWVRSRFGIYVPDGDPDPRRLCERPSWVRANDRVFLPSKLRDNPGLDHEAYVRQLMELDPTTAAQLLDGDWDAREPGDMFRRDWFPVIDEVPAGCEFVRYWDMAATEPSARNSDPDWTVGLKLARLPDGSWSIVDVQRFRKRSSEVETRVRQAAMVDGIGTRVFIEQEPGSSGKAIIEHYQRSVLPEFAVYGNPPADGKAVRARPVASKCEQGLVSIVRAPWNTAFLDEVELFPQGDQGHDDQVDALSGAFSKLSTVRPAQTLSDHPWR